MRHLVPICVGSFILAGLGVLGVLALRPPPVAQAGSAPPANPATCQDRDGDGFGLGCARGPDCNDLDSTIHPGQVETCNFRDDDCNALVDDNAGCSEPSIDPAPVKVDAGSFLMGSPATVGADDEHPLHAVQLKAFKIDRQEVTNRRYQQCVQAGACRQPALLSSNLRPDYYENPRFLDYPVVFVNWQQADQFCRNAGGRLPSEAEWEKTARGPDSSVRTFPWGDEAADCRRANMGGPGSCAGDTDRVGRRLLGASPYGALDMAGNVWEWVADWYDADWYQKSPSDDPSGPATGTLKVMRGGCWLSGSSTLRVSCRKAELPSTWGYNIGFRCAYPEGR
ncbi:MAG: SUMF1/EgtB/PvdO family nonheme iron enzyme [Deltaproteobacteria bacterium]|nr:SUMF1/EgtB/PvdO family nonheme iron enzyme [Deltaproteobacteria bacterium]